MQALGYSENDDHMATSLLHETLTPCENCRVVDISAPVYMGPRRNMGLAVGSIPARAQIVARTGSAARASANGVQFGRPQKLAGHQIALDEDAPEATRRTTVQES
jgi:hypothetical protein